MGFTEELKEAKAELLRAQTKVKVLEAEAYLHDLWQTASYTSTFLGTYEIYKGQISFQLFGDLYQIRYCAESGILLKHVQHKAKYFKDMDDSGDWPEWKREAYKAAKIYQQYHEKAF